jgi:hypothetical protein
MTREEIVALSQVRAGASASTVSGMVPSRGDVISHDRDFFITNSDVSKFLY